VKDIAASMASSSNQSQISPLTGKKDYDVWATRMAVYLRSEDAWEYVVYGYSEPADEAAFQALSNAEKDVLRAHRKKDAKALHLIMNALDNSVFPKISASLHAKAAWDTLATSYQGAGKVQTATLQNLRRDFEDLKMKESDSVDSFMTKVMGIVNQLNIYGEKIGDQRVVERVLRSLPHKFESKVSAIEEAKDLSTLSIDELTGSLLSFESRLNRNEESSHENAFKAHVSFSRGRGRGRGRGGSRGRGRSGRSNGNGDQDHHHNHEGGNCDKKRSDKSNIQCYYCNKFGHYAHQCKKKKADQANHNANVTNTSEDKDDMLFLTCHAAHESPKGLWLLDSGCSNHMTGDRGLIEDLDESVRTEVKVGTDEVVPVLGKGVVNILTKQGQQKTISDVYYAPGLKHNLLSIGQLTEKKYKLVFDGSDCEIYDPNRHLIIKIQVTRNRMYPLVMNCSSKVTSFAQKATCMDDYWLWHFRYGHLHFGGLKFLQQKEMVKGLPPMKEPESSCECCIIAKQHRDSFPKGMSRRAHAPLELIHTDLVGPMQTQSIGGSYYFLTFIDDFSRKTWVYFLRQKSETFGKFKEFRALVEKQSGYQLKVLRSDGGGEYELKEFHDYCKHHGIKRQFTTRYTPQQNGIAERKNRTIMNMARSMLKGRNVSHEFWGDAVACAVHVMNRSPTKIVKNRVPEKAWSGMTCNVSHFRVFGCVAYAHVPKQLRKKLDDRSEKCIFLGYGEQTKAYKLYNPITKKVILSRDVLFKEEESWNGTIDKGMGAAIPQPEDGEDEELIGQQDPVASSPIANTPERTPRNSVRGEASSPQSGNESDYSNKKTRRLTDIYDELDANTNYVFIASEPVFYEEAVKQEHWVNAMDEEIDSIERNDTWDLVDLPKNKKPIGVKWVYKTKLNEKGEIDRYKARLVAKGFSQQPGIDFGETFAPVARLDTVRAVLAIAAQKKWKVYQMDVKSAFLNGILEEEIYVEQPHGYEIKEHEDKVYKLKKALYGLKQAPRAWYSRIDSYLIKNGFSRSSSEPTLYTKVNQQGQILIVCLYVDDMIFTGDLSVDEFKAAMKKEFEMTDLGLMRFFLGLEVEQSEKGIFISQNKYANEVLKRFRMLNCKTTPTPVATGTKLSKEDCSPNVDPTLYKRLVGSLMYLTATRPDIMFAVSLISRFMESPKDSHWQVGKRILRYVAGTSSYGILYSSTEYDVLTGFTDSDFAGSLDDRKSTSGHVFHLGSGVISWASKKQPIVTLSSAEAEYVAATSAACQAVWLRRVLEGLQQKQEGPTTVYCDNNSAIALSKNHVFHQKSKHIDTRYHFIRELVNNGEVHVEHCKSIDQLADIFTKPLAKDIFEFHRNNLGIVKAAVVSSSN
jgi:hypothetical protein